MLYHWYELGHAAVGPVRAAADSYRLLLNSPFNPMRNTEMGRQAAAALEVFGEVAYSEAKVEQITERAGCSRPAFYQYFSSKEEVFWALATELAGEMVDLSDQLGPVTADEAGLATLTAWIDDFMALYEAWAPVFRAFPDATRAITELGWSPQRSRADIIAETVAWAR